jgi:hypothetical protein
MLSTTFGGNQEQLEVVGRGERSRTALPLLIPLSFDFPSRSGARSSQMFNHLVFVVHCVTKEERKNVR